MNGLCENDSVRRNGYCSIRTKTRQIISIRIISSTNAISLPNQLTPHAGITSSKSFPEFDISYSSLE